MAVVFFSGPEFTLCEQGAGEPITASGSQATFYSDFSNLEGCS